MRCAPAARIDSDRLANTTRSFNACRSRGFRHRVCGGRALERAGVKRILLTASGGPFRGRKRAQLARGDAGPGLLTSELGHGPEDLGRLGHADEQGPGGDRGALAVRVPAEHIDVVVHPQSVVHSLVEYADGSMLAQLGNPDMRTALAHALAFPERIDIGRGGLESGADRRVAVPGAGSRHVPVSGSRLSRARRRAVPRRRS